MRRAALIGAVALVGAGLGLSSFRPSQPDAAPTRVVSAVAELPTLLAFVHGRLVRLNPETLQRQAGRAVDLGSGGCAARSGGTACWTNPPWAASPDGTQVALAQNDLSTLQLVDTRSLRVTARIRVQGGSMGAFAWLRRPRLLAIQEVCCAERQRLVVLDLANGRVTGRRALAGSVQSLARTADELVVLLAPAQTIGPARLAVVSHREGVRFVRLERIVAGTKLLGTGSDHRVDARSPGMAVDPQSKRAFVVAGGLAAEIDLRTLTVAYHSLARRPSLLARLWSWLEPVAFAKQVSGYQRQAQWLGDHLLAHSGVDTTEGQSRAAGLVLVDTVDWSVRSIDRNAMRFEVAGDALLATGGRWDATANKAIGIGVTAYDLDGHERFQLFDGEQAWIAAVYRGLAYVGIVGEQQLRIVELATGRTVGTRGPTFPWPLVGGSGGWWE